MPLKVVPRRDRKLNRVIKRALPRDLRRGELLYGAGEPASELFLIRAGHIRLLAPESRGARGGRGPQEVRGPQKGTPAGGPAENRLKVPDGRVLAVFGPGELFGEEALLPETPRRGNAVAGEASKILALRGRGTQKALQTSPKSFEAFLRAKEAELVLARTLSASRRPGGARARLGALLLDLASRFTEKDQKGLQIPLSLTHQVLADLSDAHRSTVTTILNDWIYEGALKDEGWGIRILKPSVLQRG